MPDVFISYNRADQLVARDLARALREWQVNVWFDEWSLKPGAEWQEAIEHAIQNTPVALVLWGPSGVGPWGKPEMRACLQQGVKRGLVVVPVLMPGSPEKPKLPPILSQRTWSDLRNGPSGQSFEQLLGVILDDAQLRRDPEPIDKLVDTLIQLLSKRRDHEHHSDEFAALSTRIDPIVHEVQQRFQPKRDSIVAGAKLIRVIGTGNFGTIWEGQTLDKKERVAVKIFRLERLAEGQMLARFRRSIRAMRLLSEEKRLSKRVDKRGAVARFGVADETGLAFSMEYLSGGNLEKVQLFGWDTARKIKVALEVCAAVQFAHENGVIHRDIKPANIVLNDDNEPVLTDFDIADVKWATSLSTTVEGGLGTPVFAAPEQLEDADKADERADIYSLGRLLYFLLLERSPGFEIEKDPSLANLGGFSPALVEVVRRATQYVPSKRFSSVAEMNRALEAVETGWAGIRARVGRGARWVRRNVAVLVILALSVGGGLGWSIWQARIEREQARVAREHAKKFEELASELQRVAKRGDEIRMEKTSVEAQVAEIEKQLPELSDDARTETQSRLNILKRRLNELNKQETKVIQARERLKNELDALRSIPSTGDTSSLINMRAALPLSPSKPVPVALSCESAPECRTSGLCSDSDGRCIATAKSCIASNDCKSLGRCTEVSGSCVATNDSCQKFSGCILFGLCHESGGRCVATAESCKLSPSCSGAGLCTESEGECIATAESCKASTQCKSKGRCHQSGGKCIATAASCRKATTCATMGRCVESSGKCIATPESCKASSRCITNGQCTESDGRCVATTEDCKAWPGCSMQGKCGPSQFGCVVTKVGCMTSKGCLYYGQCSKTPDGCSAATDTHCMLSELCRLHGQCHFEHGRCVARDCADVCRQYDRCSLFGTTCVVAADSCRISRDCKERGRCKWSNGRCLVTDFGCKISTECKTHGRCTAVDGVCIDDRMALDGLPPR